MRTGDGDGPIVELLRAGVLDAELAALLALLIGARLPVVVAGRSAGATAELRAALLALLPADARPVKLAGEEEEFGWLPEATELGWRRDRGPAAGGRAGERADVTAGGPAAARHDVTAGGPGPARADPATSILVADLDAGTPGATWGARARIAIRALALGYGMLATMAGDGLEDVLATLKAPPVSADDDELSRLGVVLAVQAVGGEHDGGRSEPRPRIVAAHYLRPVARDEHGHVQRLPPAVLATWDPRAGRFEHFAWGVSTELAARTGHRPIELEREQARLARDLAARSAPGTV